MEQNSTPKEMSTEERVKLSLQKRKQRMRTRRIINWSIAAVIVAAIAVTFLLYQRSGTWWWAGPQESEAADVTVTETTVREIVVSQTIDISGSVEPYQIQQVVFRSTGAVTSVNVEEGDRVSEGDLLATIDDTSQRYEIANIENLIAEAKLEGAASQLRLYEMQLELRKNNLEYTRVYANFDGVVASVAVDEGDYAEAGTVVIILVDTSRLKATVEIDEIDMQSVTDGMEATLNFDASPNADVRAYIDYIPMLGRTTSQGIGVMDVELVIDEPPAGIAPGYTFAGTISSGSERTSLVIPTIAVSENRSGDSVVRKKGADGEETAVVVKVKYLGEGMSEVVGGDLKAGDIILTGASAATDSSSAFRVPGTGPGGGAGKAPQ
ncbi:MAG: efflux RND transporter periplasmic adaptor subunit [Sphaerochaetaceae bacterium]|nr:efflux RND transporter periplasmic adaptor subunit [Sphaerochaetaceae bacterium]